MRAPDLESGTSARRATLAVNEKGSEWDVGHEKLVGEELTVGWIYTRLLEDHKSSLYASCQPSLATQHYEAFRISACYVLRQITEGMV